MEKKERFFEVKQKHVGESPDVVQIVNEATSPFSAYCIPRSCLSKVSNIIELYKEFKK